MIIKNGKTISFVYDGTTSIEKIMKGTLKVYERWEKLFKSGELPLTIKSNGADLVDYKLCGNTYQETRSGKNLLPNNAKDEVANGITFTVNEDKSITINGTNNNAGHSNIFIVTERDNFTLQAGTYYTIASGESGVNTVGYTGTKYITLAAGGMNTFTLEEDTSFASVYVQVGKGKTTNFNNFKVYPIVSTTPITTNEYEEFGAMPSSKFPSEIKTVNGILINKITGENKEKIITYDLQGNELVSIGDVKDESNLVTGVLTKRIGKVVLNGSENIIMDDVYNGIAQFSVSPEMKPLYINDNQTRIISTHFKGVNFNNSWTKDNVITITGTGIRIMTSEYTTVEDFKQLLSENNVTAYYVLAEEKSEVIEQTNIPSFKGMNTLEIDAEIQPSNVEVTYMGKNKDW